MNTLRFSPAVAVLGRWLLLVCALAAPGLRAQTVNASISIIKRGEIRQTSATTVQDVSGLLTAEVNFTTDTMPPDVNVELRGPATTLTLLRSSPVSFSLARPFPSVGALDAAIPSGTYTLVTSRGTQTVNLVDEPTLATARVTNFDALQRWNGSDALNVTIAPTPIGVPQRSFTMLIVMQGSNKVLDVTGTLGAPSSTLSGTISPFWVFSSPGETFPATATLYHASTSSGGILRILTLSFTIARAHLPPAITTQPTSQTVNAGTTATLSVTASGGGLTYQWLKDGQAVSGGTNATLTLSSAQPAQSGSYAVAVSNTGGTTVSAAARLTVVPVVTAPTITTAPAPASVAAGARHVLTVAANGTTPLTYQWHRDGALVAGATGSELVFDAARPGDAGNYTVTITNAQGAITSGPITLTVIPVTRIANLSIRTRVGGANGPLTVGLTVGGVAPSAAKPLLIRAVGPTLGAFGVDGALADPQIALLSGATVIAQNDNWSGNAEVSRTSAGVGAFALISDASLDAALTPSTPAGGYTVRITAPGPSSGIALAEVYDASAAEAFINTTPRLTNVSALTQVGTGSDILIAGFSITGTTSKAVLIRGIGPTLAGFGVDSVLSDPKLEVFTNGSPNAIASNDDWQSGDAAAIAAAAAGVGAFPLAAGSKDAVLLLTLAPGSYTAQISGAGNTTGTALVEIYELP